MGRLSNEALPAEPGTYLLWFVVQRALVLEVGRLGTVEFPLGAYAYSGSALGPGGLRARLERHLQAGPRRPHWHVDYLAASCPPAAVHWTTGGQRLECRWAQCLHAHGASWAAAGFGSSDCRQGCGAHLLRLPAGWTILTIKDLLA